MISLIALQSLELLHSSVMQPDTSLTIRKLEPKIKQRLRERAAANARSMEDEARAILRAALTPQAQSGKRFVDSIRRMAKAAGYAELKIPPRSKPRSLPEFE